MSPDATQNLFPIVGVGASASGLDALTRLITALPSQPGLALLVVQQPGAGQHSKLPEILRSQASMPVLEATDGIRVQAGNVYVTRPDTNVALEDGQLSVAPRPDDRTPHYPIDHLFRSLAAVKGQRAVGVILSGTGSDGTLGLTEIKAAGGVTFAQEESTAQQSGARGAIDRGAVDLILPPEGIATRLIDLPTHPYLHGHDVGEQETSETGDDLQLVLAALRKASGVDFSQYRDTTVKLRTERRMLLRGFKSREKYARFVDRDTMEAGALYRDVLIHATSFFREPGVFEELKRLVFPEVLIAKAESDPVRIWIPGCSTGQEVYSVAIALLEYLSDADLRCEIKIFATDLGDWQSLEQARTGRYPKSIESEVSAERLSRFFTTDSQGYRVRKHVRDLCVFARHNIVSDPPFSRLDLVVCRNILTSTALRERSLPTFHFALNKKAFLVLGAAESVERFTNLFEPVAAAHRIFRRMDAPDRPQVAFMLEEWLGTNKGVRPIVRVEQPPDFQREADRLALTRYAPPSVLVNSAFEVLQFRGRLDSFIDASASQPRASILKLAREGVAAELKSALMEARDRKAPAVREKLHIHDGRANLEFSIRVLPLMDADTESLGLLALFEVQDWPSWGSATPSGDTTVAEREAVWLRQQLASSKQYLQSILEAHDSATQQLRVAHEKAFSTNDALQTATEALEMTKEELRSVKEELTAQSELSQNRNREIDTLADDLADFISSADVPMVTVDRELSIRRMTLAAQRAFNLLPTDVGRSIEHIRMSLIVENLRASIENVMTSMRPLQQEVQDATGRWWALKIRPYLTFDNHIDGATLVAVDIDSARRSRELAEARDYAIAVVQTVREPLVVLDAECRIGFANEAFYGLFGESPATAVGRRLAETSQGVWSEPELQGILCAACKGDRSLTNFEVVRNIVPLGTRILMLNARSIARGDSQTLLLSIDDVTEARRGERQRIDAETLRLADRRKDEFMGVLAHELRNPLGPMSFALEMLRSPASPEDSVRAREVLERQVSHMARLIDDLLDVSRISQGKVELHREPVELAAVVYAAIETCRPALEAAQHVLTVSLPDEPLIVMGDSARLTQVVVNLLNNAAKFTPPAGHIWIIAEKAGEQLHLHDAVRLRIRDTGIGIAPEFRQRVFDMFGQSGRSIERRRGGIGVGLALVRKIVAFHGGNVDVWSEGLDRGSEFVVTLPLEPAVAQPHAADSAAARNRSASKSLRILVADDNADGREMLAYLLRLAGHTVVTAPDGARALEVAEEFIPDVAVLDIGMAGLNGYELAKALRGDGQGHRPFLVALSGLGQPDDKARAMEAGFDHHFTKPVDINVLLSLVAERPRAGR